MNTAIQRVALAIIFVSLTACGGSSGSGKKNNSSSTSSISSLSSTPTSTSSAVSSESSASTSSADSSIISSSSTSSSSSSNVSSSDSSPSTTSSSDSSSSVQSSVSSALVGVFLDNAVAGLRYETNPSGKTGTTNAFGEYEYEAGDTVTFRIGNLTLPSTPAKGVITPADLARVGNIVNDETLTNILRLLQTIDTDGNLENGIGIDEDAHTLFSSANAIDFSAPVEDFASIIEGLLNGPLVSIEDAKEHFSHTLHLQLLGSWLHSEGEGQRNILTFIDKYKYIIIHEHYDNDTQSAGSVEYGTYNWDPLTGSLSLSDIEESDGNGGLWSEDGAQVTAMRLDGNSLTLTIPGEINPVFTKIQDRNNALIGAWLLTEREPRNLNVLTFLSTTEYVIAHTNNSESYPDAPNQKLSGEFGTYTLGENGQFQVTGVSVDTDGEGGAYNKLDVGDQASETIEIMPWGDLRFTDADEGTYAFGRIGYMTATLRDTSLDNPLGSVMVARYLDPEFLNPEWDADLSFTVPLADGTTSQFRFRFRSSEQDVLTVTTGEEEPEVLPFTSTLSGSGALNIVIEDGNELIHITIAPVMTSTWQVNGFISIRGFINGVISEDSLWLTRIPIEA